MSDAKIWYEWGRRDWRELGRHCGSVQRGEVRKDLADAYKAGYLAERNAHVPQHGGVAS